MAKRKPKKRGGTTPSIKAPAATAPITLATSNGTPAVPVVPPAPPQQLAPLPEMPDQVYRDERKILLDLIKGNTEQHDRSVLQLATAVLGLTITFKDKIALHPLPGTDLLMGISWVFLLGSMGTMLVSFLTGVQACKLQLSNLDGLYQDSNYKSKSNRWATATTVCNLLSFIFFVVGVGFVATYGWLNFNSSVPQVKGVPTDEKQAVQTIDPAPDATAVPTQTGTRVQPTTTTTDTPDTTTGQKIGDDSNDQ